MASIPDKTLRGVSDLIQPWLYEAQCMKNSINMSRLHSSVLHYLLMLRIFPDTPVEKMNKVSVPALVLADDGKLHAIRLVCVDSARYGRAIVLMMVDPASGSLMPLIDWFRNAGLIKTGRNSRNDIWSRVLIANRKDCTRWTALQHLYPATIRQAVAHGDAATIKQWCVALLYRSTNAANRSIVDTLCRMMDMNALWIQSVLAIPTLNETLDQGDLHSMSLISSIMDVFGILTRGNSDVEHHDVEDDEDDGNSTVLSWSASKVLLMPQSVVEVPGEDASGPEATMEVSVNSIIEVAPVENDAPGPEAMVEAVNSITEAVSIEENTPGLEAAMEVVDSIEAVPVEVETLHALDAKDVSSEANQAIALEVDAPVAAAQTPDDTDQDKDRNTSKVSRQCIDLTDDLPPVANQALALEVDAPAAAAQTPDDTDQDRSTSKVSRQCTDLTDDLPPVANHPELIEESVSMEVDRQHQHHTNNVIEDDTDLPSLIHAAVPEPVLLESEDALPALPQLPQLPGHQHQNKNSTMNLQNFLQHLQNVAAAAAASSSSSTAATSVSFEVVGASGGSASSPSPSTFSGQTPVALASAALRGPYNRTTPTLWIRSTPRKQERRGRPSLVPPNHPSASEYMRKRYGSAEAIANWYAEHQVDVPDAATLASWQVQRETKRARRQAPGSIDA